ncbi:MAG: hypothetical protein U1F57_06535 [bacterium]
MAKSAGSVLSAVPDSSLSSVSVLDRFSSVQNSGSSFTSLQTQVDGMVSGFVEQATDAKTLAAMVGGGLAYRFARFGTLALASSFVSEGGAFASFLVRGSSYVLGLAGESAAFTGIQRGFCLWEGHASSQTFAKEWLNSALSLGALKVFGKWGEGQNLILQHLMADFGMVSVHALAALLHLEEKAEGDFSTQLLHAEAMNWQMKAGMGLLHELAPTLSSFEKTTDLTLRLREKGLAEKGRKFLSLSWGENALSLSVLWTKGGGGPPRITSEVNVDEAAPLLRSRNARDLLFEDLASLRDEPNPFAEKIPGLSRKTEDRFECGDFVEWKTRKGRERYVWRGAVHGEALESATAEDYQTYLAWRAQASFLPTVPLDLLHPEVVALKKRLEAHSISLRLEGRVSREQIAYVAAVIDLLPDSFFRNRYVRRISLGVPYSKEGGVGDEFRNGEVRISQATLRGSRRMLAATLLHELAHSVEIRYTASLSELGSVLLPDPELGPPLLPDLSIPKEVREAMREHYRILKSRPEDAFVMNVLNDPWRGVWELVGSHRRRAYVTGSFQEFIPDFILYYVAGGTPLRRFITGPAQTDLVKRAYLGLYEEIRERIFDGWEYDGRGRVSQAVEAAIDPEEFVQARAFFQFIHSATFSNESR